MNEPKKLCTISYLDNGFLVSFAAGGHKAYQASEANNQIPLMVHDILRVINEHQRYKVVDANEAAKLSTLSFGAYDGPSKT